MQRKIGSYKKELLIKSREAMLCAVQIFNNPNIFFKSESFIVLVIISWTYLLHAYYRQKGIDYRYYEKIGLRRKFDRTKNGSYKYWELERCLNDDRCPLDISIIQNLKFLIGLRHEIEHQMTTNLDEYISPRYQACCLNYNKSIVDLFGERFSIDRYLAFSLQFSTISESQARQLLEFSDLPKRIAKYINDFDNSLPEEQFNNPEYSYGVLFVEKSVNRRGQADRVIEFIHADSPEAEGLNKELVLIKDREKPKFTASQVLKIIKEKGFIKFGMYQHTLLWRELGAKDESKGYGVKIASAWYWYEKWIKKAEEHCITHSESYT